jgi:hypothetical protein
MRPPDRPPRPAGRADRSPVTLVEARPAFAGKLTPPHAARDPVADDQDTTVGATCRSPRGDRRGTCGSDFHNSPPPALIERVDGGSANSPIPEFVVQVLGWSHDNFGEVRTIPSKDLFIVR